MLPGGIMDLLDIEDQGSSSFNNELHDCPYPIESREHVAWQRGYFREKEYQEQKAKEFAISNKVDELISESKKLQSKVIENDKLYQKILDIVFSFIFKYKRAGFWQKRGILKKFTEDMVDLAVKYGYDILK